MVEKKYAINPKEVEPEYQQLCAKLNFGGSKYLPRIMKKGLTLEQARISLEFYATNEENAAILGVSKADVDADPKKYQVDAIAKKLHLDKATVEKHIQYMFEAGFAFPTRKGWRFPMNAVQFENSMTNPKFDEKLGDEFWDLWDAFQRMELFPASIRSYLEKAEQFGPSFRIIPARKALELSKIPPEKRVVEDNIEEMLKLYSVIAVEHCPCKRFVRDRACQSPTEVCLIMDRVAEHNIKRGAARLLSLDEAIAIHDMASERGMFCSAQSNAVKPVMLCHCHWCCCEEMAPMIMHGIPMTTRLAKSCYQTVVSPSKCTGCQTCVKVCQFNAIEMRHYSTQERQDKLKAWVNPEKCVGCGLCVIKCPAGARTMTQVKTGDSVPREVATTEGTLTFEGKNLETGSIMVRPLRDR